MSNRTTKKTIIFDYGGVLQRTEDRQPRLAWDARLGLPSGSVERVVHGIEPWRQVQRGEITLNTYWEAVASELGLSPGQLSALQADFYSGDRLDRDLVALIRRYRQQGVPVGLLSNNSPDLPAAMEILGIGDLFDTVVISADIGIMKPDPAAYLAILNKMHIPPQKAIFIDDFIQNVEGARRVGMSAIHFESGIDLQTHLDHWLGE